MTLRIKDKVCFITGAGNGIGKAIAERFAQEGAKLFLTDIDESSVQQVADDLANKYNIETNAQLHDVTSEASWQDSVNNALFTFKTIDVLVNNAGIAIPGTVENTSLDDWRKTHAVNSEGTFLGCKTVIENMKKQGGSIINISSIEGLVGEANTAAYNSSKGGVRIFTKSTALHCAQHNYGIRVNSIHPGFIYTDMVKNALASLPAEQGKAMLENLFERIPFGEMGTTLDIANGCLFLASDESRYMTGSELVMDGGYTCR